MLGNPTGGAVVAGSATIGSPGATLTINQATNNAIINWQQFSIANGEITRFNVPTSSSATLNRVVGGNPSSIYGTLQSNGILYLLNPSGIVVGPTGRIDTAGFMASTLDVSNQQFLKGGDLNFAGASSASLDNEGSINASIGNVYLIANQVNNNGTLTAPHGNVGLAAGSDVLFQQAGYQHLFVQANPSGTTRATGVTNAGTIMAAAAEIKAAGGNAYALAINNTGAIAATGFKKVNGEVFLTSEGGSISNSGTITAQTVGGNGGKIVLNGHGTTSSGTVLNSGTLLATGKAVGKTGGTVEVLGNRVGLVNHGVVDVSGDAGGGTALIGGDEHGANPAIPNADQTYLGPDATISADALSLGTGGKVILWGNQTTQVYGQVSATGGALGDNGGFVETSAANLDARTAPNLSAPNGKAGTWLLDPSDVTISDTVSDGGFNSSPAFTITSGTVTISQTTLQSALQSGSVIIDASTGTGGGGTITWTQTSTPLTPTLSSAATLTLNAPGGMAINNVTVTTSGTAGLSFVINSSGSSGPVAISNSSITLNHGDFTAYGTGLTASSGTTSLDGIDVTNSTINTAGSLTSSGNIYLNGQAGYSTVGPVAGIGVFLDGATLETTPAGNVTVIGTGGVGALSFKDDLEGVEIEGGNLSTINGLLSINGSVANGTAVGTLITTPSTYIQGGNIFGVVVGDGATIQSTGTGSVSIVGTINPTATSATDRSIGVDISGGIGNTTGSITGQVTNPGSPVTTTISAAGGSGISITGTSGIVNNSIAGTNIDTPQTSGIYCENGVSLTASGSAPITLTGTGGNDLNTVTAGLSYESADGIQLDAGNYNSSGTPNITVQSATGAITLTGIGGSSIGSIDGVSINSENSGNASISSTAANISLIGSDPNQTVSQALSSDGGATGVDIGGEPATSSVSSITASAGSIYIQGTLNSGTDNSKEAAVVLSKGSTVTASGTGGTTGATAQGDVTILGVTTGSTALAIDAGVLVEGTGTTVSASGIVADTFGGTGLTITGISSTINGSTGTTIDQHNGTGGVPFEPVTSGIAVVNGAKIESLGAAPMTLIGTGGANSTTFNSGTNYVDPSTGETSASYGVTVFSPKSGQTTTISSGGLLSVSGIAGSSPTTGVGVMIGGPSNAGAVSVTSGGAVALIGTGGSGNVAGSTVPNAGVAIFNPANDVSSNGGTVSIAANGGDLSIAGTSGGGSNSTGVDGAPYFNSVFNASSIDPSLRTTGTLVVASTSGLVNDSGWAGEITAQNTVVTAPTGTSSILTASAGCGPLSMLGGSDFTVTGYPAGSITLDASTVNNLTVTNNGGIALQGIIAATGLVNIQDKGGDITFGSGGAITDSGAGNNVILAAGTSLANAHYIINNSTVGESSSNAIQVSGGSNFYLYSKDPTGDTFGGVTVLPANMINGATFATTGLPAASEELFYSGTGGSGGSGGSSGSTPPSTSTGGAAGGGSNIVPPALTPPSPPLVTPGTILPGGTGPIAGNLPPPPLLTFAGNSTPAPGLSGAPGGQLADFSSSGGQVAAGDAASLGGGGLGNVNNPQATGALNQALGPVVYHNLADALKELGDWANVPPGPPVGDSGGTGQETVIGPDQWGEMDQKTVKNIPSDQVPQQLKNALGNNVLNGVPGAAGH